MDNSRSSIITIKKIIVKLSEVIKLYDEFDLSDQLISKYIDSMKSRDIDNILILSNILEDYYYGSEDK